MRVLELFAGYGSQALALENLGIEFTSDISEIDKYAIQAYNQLHGDTHNWGDITKIDETKLPYYDLITYSSPCQDFSVAGLQKGGDKDSGTRSSLLWECERIIRAVKPKYLLMENVKNLVGEKHKHNFIRWLHVLENMGYQNFWKVLNAKDYGVPQNRERVFVVSILGCGQYLFPNPIKLEKRLKDVLEENVDEKYYLSDKITKQFAEKLSTKEVNNAIRCGGGGSSTDEKHSWDIVCVGGMQEHQSITIDGTSTCLTSSMGSGGGYVPMITEPFALDEQNNCIRKDGTVGTLTTDGSSPKHNNRVLEPVCVASRGRENGQELEVQTEPITNALTSVQKDNMLLEPTVNQIGNIFQTDSFGGNPQIGRVYSDNGLSPTLNTMQGGQREPKILQEGIGNNPNKFEFNGFHNISPTLMASDSKNVKCYSNGYRIRKLTPLECWRLMGVKDEQFNKLHGISNSQLYKLAGNSIVVDVLMGIFKNLLLSDKGTSGQLTLF